MISPAPPLRGGTPVSGAGAQLAPALSLRGRVLAVRRRRLALRVRDWLGVGVIAAFSLTMFAVTFFSLLGR